MKHTDDIRLNKCLHCGGTAYIHHNGGKACVICEQCGIATMLEKDIDKAVKVWNRCVYMKRRRTAEFLEDLLT